MINRRSLLASGASLAGAVATKPLLAQKPTPNRAAVVIGVDKVGNLPVLSAAASGARKFGKWLMLEGFDVKLIVDSAGPVRLGHIFDEIEALVARGTLEQLVVYFSGHGFLSGYLSEVWMLSNAPNNPNEAISLFENVALA